MRFSAFRCAAAAALVTLSACTSPDFSQVATPSPSVAYAASNSVSHSSKYSIVLSFGYANGFEPLGALIVFERTFFGTTEFGGSGNGTVFSLSPTGTEHVLHAFGGANDSGYPTVGLTLFDGVLYGVTTCNCTRGPSDVVQGTIFTIRPDGSGYKVLHRFNGGTNGSDGEFPSGPLLAYNGLLYGEAGGGTNGSGLIFSIEPNGKNYHIIYNFANVYTSKDGAVPYGGMIIANKTFYGTTWRGGGTTCPNPGGPPGCGTVFSITLAGAEHVLYRFKDKSDGLFPVSGVIDVDGALYGVTDSGGGFVGPQCPDDGCGVAFRLDSSGKETVLHRFSQSRDGGRPDAGLLELGGTFYGTLEFGTSGTPNQGFGSLFKMSPAGGVTILHAFGGLAAADGGVPNGLTSFDDAIYGTTQMGSTIASASGNGYGTVYRVMP